MKSKAFALAIILLAAGFLFLQYTTVKACEPESDENLRCVSWRFPRANVTPSAIVAAPTITRTLVAAVVGTNTPALPATFTPLPSLTPLPTFTPTITPTPRFTATGRPSPTDTPLPSDTPTLAEVPFPTETPTGIDLQSASDTPTPNAASSPTPTLAANNIGGATPTRTRTLTLAARVTASPTPTVNKTTTAKSGDSPFAALEISDELRTLTPRQSLWYKIGNESTFPFRGRFWLDASVDENGRRNLSLAIFAPEQASDLNAATVPKGRGAYNKLEPSHALMWLGGSPRAGIWYALVSNSNPFPVQYKLGSDMTATQKKDCNSYWEYLPDGQYVYWTACK